MKKQNMISLSDPGWRTMTLEERNSERIDHLTNLVEQNRRTGFFKFIIGMLFGCAGTLIGIGIGKYIGGL